MKNGVLARKVEIISETVRKIRGLPGITIRTLDEDYFLKRGIERSLQISIEAILDIAHRLISLLGQPPASTGSKALEALESLGVIRDASSYKKMIQFRNLVVHRYDTVDNAVLLDILRNHLDDFDRFVGEIRKYEDRSDR